MTGVQYFDFCNQCEYTPVNLKMIIFQKYEKNFKKRKFFMKGTEDIEPKNSSFLVISCT